MILLIENRIDEAAVLDSVKSNTSGAAVLFIGTTRQYTSSPDNEILETTRLTYEGFAELAFKELAELVDLAKQKWPIEKCSIVHRLGQVDVGQTSIALAVSSPHRIDAFEAASWLMDELKRKVPIWKKENWVDGTSGWVHPGVDTANLAVPKQDES